MLKVRRASLACCGIFAAFLLTGHQIWAQAPPAVQPCQAQQAPQTQQTEQAQQTEQTPETQQPAPKTAAFHASPAPQNDLAQVSIENLMNMEVTSASKKEQKLSQVAAAVFVITQEDIRSSGADGFPGRREGRRYCHHLGPRGSAGENQAIHGDFRRGHSDFHPGHLHSFFKTSAAHHGTHSASGADCNQSHNE
jgi:hypothetical protein